MIVPKCTLKYIIDKLFLITLSYLHIYDDVGWLVGCFGLNGPLGQYFSLYRVVSQREGERRKK